jgi:hypothetical protein
MKILNKQKNSLRILLKKMRKKNPRIASLLLKKEHKVIKILAKKVKYFIKIK